MTPTRWTEEKKNLSTDSLIARGIYGNANDRNCSGSAYDSTPCLSALPYCLYTINLPLIPLSGISYENVECSGLLSFSNASEGVLALHTDHTGLQHFSFSPQSAEWSRCCHAILSSRKWLFSHLWVGGGLLKKSDYAKLWIWSRNECGIVNVLPLRHWSENKERTLITHIKQEIFLIAINIKANGGLKWDP